MARTLPRTQCSGTRRWMVPAAVSLGVMQAERKVSKQEFTQMEVLGQFNRGFIIARLRDDLYIIDQVQPPVAPLPPTHARSMPPMRSSGLSGCRRSPFSKSNRLFSTVSRVHSAPYWASPIKLELSPGDDDVIRDNLDVFNAFGVARASPMTLADPVSPLLSTTTNRRVRGRTSRRFRSARA